MLRRPKGLRAPWNPRQGAPCTARLISAFRRPCRGLRRGAGVPGKSAPTPCRQAWVAPVASRGRVLAPAGLRGRTNPLTRPPLENAPERPAQGLEGHCRSGWGSRLAQRPRSGLALTPRNDPNAPGWWLGVLFPQPPATWRTPPEAAGGALDLLLLRAVSEKHLSAPSARRTRFGSGF